MRAAVLTVSDGVVAGTREDTSGAVLEERLRRAGFATGQDIAGDVVCGQQAADVGGAGLLVVATLEQLVAPAFNLMLKLHVG